MMDHAGLVWVVELVGGWLVVCTWVGSWWGSVCASRVEMVIQELAGGALLFVSWMLILVACGWCKRIVMLFAGWWLLVGVFWTEPDFTNLIVRQRYNTIRIIFVTTSWKAMNSYWPLRYHTIIAEPTANCITKSKWRSKSLTHGSLILQGHCTTSSVVSFSHNSVYVLLTGLHLLLCSRAIQMLMLLLVVVYIAICGSCSVSRRWKPTLHLGLWIGCRMLDYLVESIWLDCWVSGLI